MARRVLALVCLGVALIVCVAIAASESLTNRTGKTATAVTVTFSEQVRITSYDEGVFPTKDPSSHSDTFRFTGGQLENGARFSVSWTPSTAEITSTEWETTGAGTGSSASSAALTYEQIMAQIAHYPGPDEPLYVPAEGEQIWLTDLEGHADIYDNDSIKINYAPGFDKSQLTRIDAYRNGVKLRFVPTLFDVLSNEQMKTFDGNPAENTPASGHTDHAIWGYEYRVQIVSSTRQLVSLATAVRSPVGFPGEALAFVGQNFFDWLRLSDADLNRALQALKEVGFSGVQVDLNYYMASPTATEVVPQYTFDPEICEVWQRTPTPEETQRMLRLARAAGMATELRIQVQIAKKAQAVDARWRGDIAPRNVGAWFADYSRLCVDLAALAEREGVNRFALGVELNSMEQYTQNWREIAAAVRTVFSGEITFAQCTALYLAASHRGGTSLDQSVGTFWNALDLIEVNMWPGAGEGMMLEVQADQRFSVLLQHLVVFWQPAFDYYGSRYPGLRVCFGELGTFDYDGALITDDFYGAWMLPGARLDHQEYVDTWAAYLCMAAALRAAGLAAWTVTLDPDTPQWTGTHQLNMTPALRTFRAVLGADFSKAP